MPLWQKSPLRPDFDKKAVLCLTIKITMERVHQIVQDQQRNRSEQIRLQWDLN